MKDLASLLSKFREATGVAAALWTSGGGSAELSCDAASPGAPVLDSVAGLPDLVAEQLVITGDDGHVQVIERLPGAGSEQRWLAVGAPPTASVSADAGIRFLAPVVAQFLKSDTEVSHATLELAERYEEINLLYTISEILGHTVTLQDATATILTEICATVGAEKGAILVHHRVTDTLQAVAAVGAKPIDTPPIAADDARSVSAVVFRTRHARLVPAGEMISESESLYREGAMLSVPIIWTSPEGGVPLGVVNLSGRQRDHDFTAGDQKLVTAIATQIANAIQNARLVRESLSQQRLAHEMQLAQDLQMRLLPDCSAVAADATVAARVVSAESVGGDFYNLFPLQNERTGAMIADVSGHGYRSALIMALAMSASAIHAQTTNDPGEMLNALRSSLQEELLTTEMFITAFYGVVDKRAGALRFANAGHPHAFLVHRGGAVERLPALNPPLGMSDDFPLVCEVSWTAGEDLLLLFTDGVTDSRNVRGERLGEQAVLDIVAEHQSEHPEKILKLVFAALREHSGEVARRDDLTVLVLRS